MQFDNQQNVDSGGQGNPFDPTGQAAADRVNDAIDEFGNRIPGGQKSADQARQAAGQGFDSLQQGQQGMGNLDDSLQQQAQQGIGGMGDMVNNQSNQQGLGANAQPPTARADPNNPGSNDPTNPYGNVDDVVADYGNTQPDQGQQGISNV